jgi:hypothetical protein
VPEGEEDTVWSTGVVSADTLAWIEEQLQNSEATHNILMCHYSIVEDLTYADFKWWIRDSFTAANDLVYDGHKDDILALANTYGAKLYLSGHEHNANFPTGTAGVLTNLNIGSATEKFCVCEITDTDAIFTVYSIATLTVDTTIGTEGVITISLV